METIQVTLCLCGLPATANGRECPKHYRERLASVRLDPSVTATRTKVNYFDRSSLDETFGEDRVDRYWDETDGNGALIKGPDGGFYHKDHHGEIKAASDELIATYVEGEDTADAV